VVLFDQKGMTFLEVIVATSIGAASMWAAASFFSFNVRQTRAMNTSKIVKRFEEEARLLVAARFQAYLDRIAVPSSDGEICDNQDSLNDFVKFMDGTDFGQTPIILDSGIQLEVLDAGRYTQFLLSSGNGSFEFDVENRSAPYASALRRCKLGQISATERLEPYLYPLASGQAATNKDDIPAATDFHFCMWMRPVNASLSQLTREVGMMEPAIFEARYTVKNATTGQTIPCRDMDTGTNSELFNTPLLFDQVANTMGCTIDGTGTLACTGCSCTTPGCDLWDACVFAYKSNSVWKTELAARIKKARVGNLNYSLHWIANGMEDASAFGKKLGAYLYTAGN
jgi:hypothetical protein